MSYHEVEKPKLVVGVMVDQLRPDYIDRFWDKLGDDGFKRLATRGFVFTNHHFDYMYTATGPGHAGVYTGTTPSVHGAMGNSWYVRDLERSMNVIEVPGYDGVGSVAGTDESKGPGNLLVTTFGDELRLHTNFRSKVVSMSRKDRGAILPGGHTGDAYWYEAATGNFVTSTFYQEELPGWVQEFNSQNLADEYLSQPWETLLPIEEYTESREDDNSYENLFDGETAPVFPHDLPALVSEHGYGPGLLSSTPFSDKLLTELAISAIEGEELGRDEFTDLLAVSFSAVDAVGHGYGPASKELQDAVLRLDRYLARLLDYLDREIGMENVLLFLTSDHGAAYVPDYVTAHGIPGGHFDTTEKMEQMREFLTDRFGVDVLLAHSTRDLFLDHELMDQYNLDPVQVQTELARFVRSLEGVAGAVSAETLINTNFSSGNYMRARNGFNPQRSGDVVFWLEPQITPGTSGQGTTHGSSWGYDTHSPLYWYGWEIPAGHSAHPVFISDIAPTVSTFLRTPYPNGTTGNPMTGHIK